MLVYNSTRSVNIPAVHETFMGWWTWGNKKQSRHGQEWFWKNNSFRA